MVWVDFALKCLNLIALAWIAVVLMRIAKVLAIAHGVQ